MESSATEPKDFIPYPTNRVVGTVADADHAQAAINALLQAGFEQLDIDVLHGEGGAATARSDRCRAWVVRAGPKNCASRRRPG